MTVLFYVFLLLALSVVAGVIWTKALAGQAERTVPQVGDLCRVPGGVLHYIDSGPRDGPVLVLIHGLAGQLQHFTYGMVDLLNDDFRVIALDRPGCGYSRVDGGGGASLGEQARMIDALLEALGIGKAVLVGHSLGGAVALRMALDFPSRVSGLALLSPLTRVPDEIPDVSRGLQISTPWLRRFLSVTFAVPMARITADKVLAQVFSPETCPQDFMDRAGAILGLRSKGYVVAASDMTLVPLEMPAQSARYGKDLSTPGAILFAEEDMVLSPKQHGQGMVEFGLRLEVLPAHGHMIPITAPQDCAGFVRRTARDLG